MHIRKAGSRVCVGAELSGYVFLCWLMGDNNENEERMEKKVDFCPLPVHWPVHGIYDSGVFQCGAW